MNAEGFIAGRLRFKGRLAMAAIAISFLIMIAAVAISGGFRHEIRNGVSDITGDILLTDSSFNYFSENAPVSSTPSFIGEVEDVKGVESLRPVIYRAGIVKAGDDIQGVLFKGVTGRDSSMLVTIPSRLARNLGLGVGDEMLSYFVGEKVKARKFKIDGIYDSLVDTDESMIVYAPLEDMRRVNGWEEGQVSAIEVRLDGRFKSRASIKDKAEEIGSICLLNATDEDDALVATASTDKYPQLFDWLDLIDFNVVAILVLMTIVAGFNMISGLLIMLFRNISTIGTLKALGMSDKGIAGVFIRVAARIVAVGMLAGNVLALAFCLLQSSTHLIGLNPENYFVSFVPVKVNLPLILSADIISFTVIILLMTIPTLFIAKVDPARTIRTE